LALPRAGPPGGDGHRRQAQPGTVGNPGHWRAVGDDVSEMKIDVGKGYRVYFTQRGNVLVIILCGGDKSTQAADIKRAKAIAKELEF
jgi:putative addiction module killer protein